MLHYDPQHVSSSTLLILRRTNCITTASGIVTLEIGERSYINKMMSAVLLSQYCFDNTADIILLIYDRSPISRVTIPEAVVIQFVHLRMSSVLLETC